MRRPTIAGLCLLAAGVVACTDGTPVLGPSFSELPFECIHVDGAGGIAMECGYGEPEDEGGAPAVYLQGDGLCEAPGDPVLLLVCGESVTGG